MRDLHLRSPKVVKLVHGLHQEGPRVVGLEVGLYHGCPGSDYRIPGVVKLVMELARISHMWGFTKDVTLGSMRCPEVVKLVMWLHHQRCKKVKCMMKLHHGSSKGCEASIGASP